MDPWRSLRDDYKRQKEYFAMLHSTGGLVGVQRLNFQ